MKTIINENQRGLLFNNGKFIKLLEPGKYHTFFGRSIEVCDLDYLVFPCMCSLDTLLQDKKFSEQTVSVDVSDEELALHFVNGKFNECLKSGKYAYWSVSDKHEFKIINISSPEVSDDVPIHIFKKIPSSLFTKIEVCEYEKARLYFDHKFIKLLEPGIYYFWKSKTEVYTEIVDTRLTQLNIPAQEILTLDKVSLRINFVCNYRITDYIKISSETDNYLQQIYTSVQFALRDYVGKYRLDEILQSKEQISSYVFEKVKEKAKTFYVEITDAGVKDIILPGEIRDIMNTVLVAEKRAQSNVIARREEVASTRSLLNTAKLMDENKTLCKLKELEYLEKIFENVGNININGNGDILSQLLSIIK